MSARVSGLVTTDRDSTAKELLKISRISMAVSRWSWVRVRVGVRVRVRVRVGVRVKV